MDNLTPERLAKLREAIAALQSAHYKVNASCFDSPLAAYIAAADPQTVLALVEEVERLRSTEATLVAIVRDLNAAREYGGSKLGLGGAYGAVVMLIEENKFWMEECYHQQSKAERLQARVAELEKNQ